MPNYRIVPDRSQVWIEAKSSLHPIHGEGRGLSGSVEAEVVDGRLNLDGTPQIQLELPVEALKSGKAVEDAEMMRRVDARRYPTIRGDIREFRVQPPKILMLKVHPDVKVRVRVVAQQEE